MPTTQQTFSLATFGFKILAPTSMTDKHAEQVLNTIEDMNLDDMVREAITNKLREHAETKNLQVVFDR